MSRIDLAGALEMLQAADSFLVTSHTSPDGDSMGCILGMKNFLRALGKTQITCVLHDPVPRPYEWLPGAEDVMSTTQAQGSKFDVAIILDVAQRERIGDVATMLVPDKPALVLDHHPVDSPEGTHNFVDPDYSSASEIVMDLFELANLPYTPEAALCLYVGLVTDTGGFRFGNTNSGSHRRAVGLLDAGVDTATINSRVFDVMSRPKKDLLSRVLERMTVVADGRLAYSYLTLQDSVDVGARPEDVDGLVNFVRNLENVRAGILFREFSEGRIKISMRSNAGVNSSDILAEFGGGGHAGAAGATVDGDLKSVQDAVVQRTEEALAAQVEG